MRRAIGLSDLVLYTILIILWALLQGCHPVFVSEDRMTLYSKPAGSAASTRPLLWIYFHNRASDLYDASNFVRAILGSSCGFQIAGVAFTDSGMRVSPPHQFRLDVSIQDRADVTAQDERNYEYHDVMVRARLVRVQDDTQVAEGQGAERYDAYRSQGYVQGARAYPERQSAIRHAMERALVGMCVGRRFDYEPAPYPYDAGYGLTVCGYGASGRMTKKGAWDMRYDCRRY